MCTHFVKILRNKNISVEERHKLINQYIEHRKDDQIMDAAYIGKLHLVRTTNKYIGSDRRTILIDLHRADLRGVDFTGIGFGVASMRRKKIIYLAIPANATEKSKVEIIEDMHISIEMRKANLRYTNLSHVNLEDVNLENADLRGANLTGTNLKNANLAGANLEGAILINTNLEGANLVNARLGKTAIHRALAIKPSQLSQAYYWGTPWPHAGISHEMLKEMQSQAIAVAKNLKDTILADKIASDATSWLDNLSSLELKALYTYIYLDKKNRNDLSHMLSSAIKQTNREKIYTFFAKRILQNAQTSSGKNVPAEIAEYILSFSHHEIAVKPFLHKKEQKQWDKNFKAVYDETVSEIEDLASASMNSCKKG